MSKSVSQGNLMVAPQATSQHLGMLKAKLAKLKRDLIDEVSCSA
jgi:ribosome-interacting GTPase 1